MSHPLRRPQLARGIASLLQAATASIQQSSSDSAITAPPLAVGRPNPAAPRL